MGSPVTSDGRSAVGLMGVLHVKAQPRLVKHELRVESTRATISCATNRKCFSQIEYWPATSLQDRRSTKRSKVADHLYFHLLPELKPHTSYLFNFLFTDPADEDGKAYRSEVFEFTTRPEK